MIWVRARLKIPAEESGKMVGVVARSCAVLALASLSLAAPARADNCQTVSVDLQPVAYPASKDPKGVYEAGGPQVAIWLADADGKWVADVAVTRMTAILGIGNRPGVWNFGSSPKFPYGRRLFDLPVWAYSRAAARGVWYREVVMAASQPETTLGWHENVSSPEPYYCRPLRHEEQVDAITCPTPSFTSCKGTYSERRNPYPPRNDIARLTGRDDAVVGGFQTDNDVDVVATATPVPGRTSTTLWTLPAELAAGDYTLLVEVNKEYDQNDAHRYVAQIDSMGLTDQGYGNQDNLGQPSIVWRVPIRLDDKARVATALEAAGYGAPTPMDDARIDTIRVAGDAMSPIDATISDSPGSGLGRLGAQTAPEGDWKVRVATSDCISCVGIEAPDPVGDFHVTELAADSAVVEFTQTGVRSGPDDLPARSYEVRFLQGTIMTPEMFDTASPAPAIKPEARGTPAHVSLTNLKPDVEYVVGLRVSGPCRKQTEMQTAAFRTPKIKFKTVEGCFLATAAYGSALEPEVETLRRFRDRVLLPTVTGRVLTTFYYQVSPALAHQLRGAEWARGMVRLALGPAVDLARVGLGLR